MAWSQNFKNWPAENGDQLAAKKTDNGYECKGCPTAHVEFYLN